MNGKEVGGIPTDGIASIQTRRSMQAQRSLERHRLSTGSISYSTRGGGDREGLMHAYDEENGGIGGGAGGGFGLTDLTEESADEEIDGNGPRHSKKHGSIDENGNGNGNGHVLTRHLKRPSR